MRYWVSLAVLAGALGAFAGTPADRVTLNKEAKPLGAEEWLTLISRQARSPVVMVGPLSGRRAAYVFDGEMLGDGLDDLSGFYGWAWRQQGGCFAVTGQVLGPAMPPKLAEWLDKRRQALMVPISYREALALATYPDDVLVEVGRACATIGLRPRRRDCDVRHGCAVYVRPVGPAFGICNRHLAVSFELSDGNRCG